VIREPRSLLHGYGQGGPDLMFRPANSNRKIVIDVAVASSVKVRNKERQAKRWRLQTASGGSITFGFQRVVTPNSRRQAYLIHLQSFFE